MTQVAQTLPSGVSSLEMSLASYWVVRIPDQDGAGHPADQTVSVAKQTISVLFQLR